MSTEYKDILYFNHMIEMDGVPRMYKIPFTLSEHSVTLQYSTVNGRSMLWERMGAACTKQGFRLVSVRWEDNFVVAQKNP
jgi:hypothetical protein